MKFYTTFCSIILILIIFDLFKISGCEIVLFSSFLLFFIKIGLSNLPKMNKTDKAFFEFIYQFSILNRHINVHVFEVIKAFVHIIYYYKKINALLVKSKYHNLV